MYKLFIVLGILGLLVGGLIVYDSPVWENLKIDCNKFDSNGVRIVCGGESYMIEGQTYGYGNKYFVYEGEE